MYFTFLLLLSSYPCYIDNPSIDLLLYIITCEINFGTSVSLNMTLLNSVLK